MSLWTKKTASEERFQVRFQRLYHIRDSTSFLSHSFCYHHIVDNAAMMSTLLPQDDDRLQRLAAIAQLEERHKMRRSHIETEGQIDTTSPRAGKYFLLLVSKGSGNLQQRANQDRAETMLNGMPHEILDGSNFALSAKRDELFGISDLRGNYPQLFLVDNGVTSFIGAFDVIEYHNDEGTLKKFLEEQPKSPKKKTSIVGVVKNVLKGGSSRKDGKKGKKDSTARTSNRSIMTDVSVTPETVQEEQAPDLASPGKKQPKDKRSRRPPMELNSKASSVLEEEAKPASTGRLVVSKSDGDLPLIDEEDKKEKKSKGDGRSRSNSRSKDMKRSSSRSKHRSEEGELQLKDENDDGSKKSSRSGRSRSRSAGKYREKKEKEDKEGEDDEKADGEKKEKSKSSKRPSRSRSRGRLRESTTADGEIDLKETGDENTSAKRRSSRSKSRSKRDLRTTEKNGKDGEPANDEKASKPRKPRSKRELITNDGDDENAEGDSPSKPKSRTKLREKDAEKHPRRSTSVRSASPHGLREKTKRSESVRSSSPGNYRGGIAAKREAMKEFREKKSVKNLDDDADTGTKVLRRHTSVKQLDTSGISLLSPRKHTSVKQLDTSGISLLSPTKARQPKRHQSLHNFNKKDKNSDRIDESLHDLVMRVKEKDKKARGVVDHDDDTSNAGTAVVSLAGSAVPSVQW